jgi:hypothetical protein
LDETGEEFSTREEAIARASVLAAELTKEGDWSGYAYRDGSRRRHGRAIAGVKSRLLYHGQCGENT